MKKETKKKLIISLSVIIPLILIITFTLVYNLNPSFQIFISGKDVIRHSYEEFEGGSNEIFISEKDGQLYFDVYKRSRSTVFNGFLGNIGESESIPQKLLESFALEGYSPEGSAMVFVFDQQVLDGRIDSKFKTLFIQKAPENAKDDTQKFKNYNVTSEIIEHKGNRYQLVTAHRIINHDMNNFGIEEMLEFISEINN